MRWIYGPALGPSEKETAMKIIMNHHTGNKPRPWPWANFKPHELSSNGNGAVQIEKRALDRLQALRTEWGEPIILSSAYRDPAYNKQIGGATNSYHVQGQAFDIPVRGWDIDKRRRFVALAYKHGFRGFGGYDKNGKANFIHIDDRGHPGKWGKSWAWPNEYKPKKAAEMKPLAKPLDDKDTGK